MKVTAFYIESSGSNPVLLNVRIHTKWDSTSMDAPTNSGTMVSRQSIFPKILFMLDELRREGITLRKRAIVSVEPGEAYKLDHSEPPDDISQSWIVTPLDAGDAEGLPVPGGL